MSDEKFKILVADDSTLYKRLVKETLSSQPCTLLFAKNGREALDLFAEHLPPLVITDWVMPEVDGPELCRRIRADFPNVYTHLMLLTSNDEKESVIAGLQAGADDYLSKPFHAGELVARVNVGRRMARLQREIQAKNRQLEELALTDALTGLPNRRAIDVWAPRQLSAALRYEFPMWVVMADLDFFKKINDTYGHGGGDTVLQGFAEILKKNTRSSDICGRIGGEEFLLGLTHVEHKNMGPVLERIRLNLEQQEFLFQGKIIRVTASFGVAGLDPKNPGDFASLITNADAALYSAKRHGRNRVEFEGSLQAQAK
ncbi:MAG: GGDEF domain-containing response regulator [Terriglobales bacterium]